MTMCVVLVHMSLTVKNVNWRKTGNSKYQSVPSVKLRLHSLKRIQNLIDVLANKINFYQGGTSVLPVHSTQPHALKSLADLTLVCLPIHYQSKDAHVYSISISTILGIALIAMSTVRLVPIKHIVTLVSRPLSCKMESVNVVKVPI